MELEKLIAAANTCVHAMDENTTEDELKNTCGECPVKEYIGEPCDGYNGPAKIIEEMLKVLDEKNGKKDEAPHDTAGDDSDEREVRARILDGLFHCTNDEGCKSCPYSALAPTCRIKLLCDAWKRLEM